MTNNVSIIVQNEKSVLIHFFVLISGKWVLDKSSSIKVDSNNISSTDGNIIFINQVQKEEVLVVSIGFKQSILKVGISSEDSVFEIEEQVDSSGIIRVGLEESNINKVLRAIYQRGVKHVRLCLLNSIYNSKHEKSISNLLHVAGYKVAKSGDDYAKSIKKP